MIERITSSVIGESCIKYVHPCGVTVFMLPMKGYSTVTAQFSVRFGSQDCRFRIGGGEEITIPDGTAHYLEHKLFESEEKDAFALFAQTGASCNAGTSYDYTVYYFSCAENFAKNLGILLGFVQQPYFTPENVEKERGIIEQEITMYQDSPNWRVIMELLSGVYSENPIKTDVAGTAESISHITDKILYDVYNAFYNPANMYLCIAGNFDPDEAIRVCEQSLNDREPLDLEPVPFTEPYEVAKKRTEISMPVAKPLFAIGFKRPDADGYAALEEYIYYNIIFDCIFGDMSDFYTRMRDEGYLNDSFGDAVFKGRGYVMPYAIGESDDPDHVLEEMKKEIRKFKADPPTREMFSRIKKATYGDCARTYNNVEATAQTLTDAALAGTTPFSNVEAAAGAEYEKMLEKLAGLDEENVCLSVIRPL